ncbi:MAG: cytochrome c peroxidase [Caldilineales bacterium]
MNRRRILLLMVGVIAVVTLLVWRLWPHQPVWTAEESAAISSLWIGNLPVLSPDPSNRYGDDPAAAALGQKFFFDTRFSLYGDVSCASCHLPELDFQDNLPLGQGVGTTTRRTMPVAGTAYSPWLFWDGRTDSQWAQALAPLESAVEHGGNRTLYAHLIAENYRAEYEALFGPLPSLMELPRNAGPVADEAAAAAWQALTPQQQDAVNRVYANMGKAIAAYERLLLPGAGRFDAYAAAVIADDTAAQRRLFTVDEAAGLRLFIGEAQCTRCHNGPLLTNNDFHNTGVPLSADLPEDTGRAAGAQQVLADPFNCLGAYSDAQPEQCEALRFMRTVGPDLARQFKPPSLRNVATRAPYTHAGQFATLEALLTHYNDAPQAPLGFTDLEPLGLSRAEMAQLIAFLRTLDSPVNAEPHWLQSPF